MTDWRPRTGGGRRRDRWFYDWDEIAPVIPFMILPLLYGVAVIAVVLWMANT